MNEMKALAARLLQNPDLIKTIKDPQALAQLAGVGEEKLQALAGIGNTLSGLLGVGKPAGAAKSPRLAQTSPIGIASRGNSTNSKATAITGTVSLTAITGAVVAVGLVSAVALSKSNKARQS